MPYGEDVLMNKVEKLLRLATDNPQTPEQKSAFKNARVLIEEINRRKKGPVKAGPILALKGKQEPWLSRATKALGGIIRFEKDPRIILKITPDSTVHSGKEVESILNTFHSMYESFWQRIWYDRKGIVIKEKNFVSYRILFETGRITFYLVVPSQYEKAVRNSINNVWSKCAVDAVDNFVDNFDPDKTVCGYLDLRDHYFKSTLVDRTRVAPMPSLMSAGRNVMEDDVALLDISFVPVGRGWQNKARLARIKHKRGEEVKKPPSNLSDILWVFGDFIDVVINKCFWFVDNMVGAEEKKRKGVDDISALEYLEMKSSRQLSNETKYDYNGFDVITRIASMSTQRSRADLTMNSIATAFKDISADNELDLVRAKNQGRFLKTLGTHSTPVLRINGNILSVPESSQILQLPQIGLQEEYPEIVRIGVMQTMADSALTKGGMPLGTVDYKNQKTSIYHPYPKIKNWAHAAWDDFCLARIVMGGQGQGKTKGYISNTLVEAYLNGFGALAIDAAKREIGDQVQWAVDCGVIPAEDFIRINVTKTPFCLDWVEALQGEKGRSRLAATAIDFFNVQNETDGQTGRFMRACIMAMETGKMSEILEIFENEKRLDRAIASLPKGGIHRQTLEQYKSGTGMRKQYTSPIYNRIEEILGDELLMECLECNNSLNMVDLMSQKKIIVFDVADADGLVPIQQDVIVNLITSKIDLAMRLRKEVHGPQAEFPFFVCMDEPDKYIRSAKIWASSVTQARKWRICFVWAFHMWEKIPKDMQLACRNALLHYHIYPTSKMTWDSLKEEMRPFNVEDGLKIKKYHALNIIRHGDGTLVPVVAKMIPPPTDRFKKK